ncbi:hypothetical protein M406DRAFT_354022 [Cryphonectria parasitica EP155]|uniref:Uncharacterized protein n=1 Tax=Cryphonectria parasitica (strain ATCC 38755 / EP155) TaxID=660469 RepID=A0A9P4YAI6_CRYP1|nr:uncharacterized protein M406DRAFT_354022 [Cryphonectria parasitica EP155]KAF3769465.1 hypothetical protein M406DRAFT_354022 [Cryphonectria parasitica EP155]
MSRARPSQACGRRADASHRLGRHCRPLSRRQKWCELQSRRGHRASVDRIWAKPQRRYRRSILVPDREDSGRPRLICVGVGPLHWTIRGEITRRRQQQRPNRSSWVVFLALLPLRSSRPNLCPLVTLIQRGEIQGFRRVTSHTTQGHCGDGRDFRRGFAGWWTRANTLSPCRQGKDEVDRTESLAEKGRIACGRGVEKTASG